MKKEVTKDTVIVNGKSHTVDLVALICYHKLRKKCPGTVSLCSDHSYVCLCFFLLLFNCCHSYYIFTNRTGYRTKAEGASLSRVRVVSVLHCNNMRLLFYNVGIQLSEKRGRGNCSTI